MKCKATNKAIIDKKPKLLVLRIYQLKITIILGVFISLGIEVIFLLLIIHKKRKKNKNFIDFPQRSLEVRVQLTTVLVLCLGTLKTEQMVQQTRKRKPQIWAFFHYKRQFSRSSREDGIYMPLKL